MSVINGPLKPISLEFKTRYGSRLIYGHLLFYGLLIFSILGRGTLDRLGIWQGALFTCVVVGWASLFMGALFFERYHNFGKNNRRYKEVRGLHPLYQKYTLSMSSVIFLPLLPFMWIHLTLPDYVKNVVHLESSDDLNKQDWSVDYYQIDAVRMASSSFYWFWQKDIYREELKGIDVTGFRRIEQVYPDQNTYFYSKKYSYSSSNIAEDQIVLIRNRLYNQAKQELGSPAFFKHQCLKRIRSSKIQKYHLSTLKDKGKRYKAKETLFVQKVAHPQCHPPILTGGILFQYLMGCSSLFLFLLYLMKVMVRTQHEMVICMENHQKKLEQEKANEKEFKSAWDYPL